MMTVMWSIVVGVVCGAAMALLNSAARSKLHARGLWNADREGWTRAVVTVDGHQIYFCLAAHTVEGWADVMKLKLPTTAKMARKEDGQVMNYGTFETDEFGALRRYRLHGKVEVKVLELPH